MADFVFKQFGICQDKCAMKVGTDGVLLGAWAPGGKRILDVGTGTGLIALMMAQRCPGARVLGIDIDADACRQALDNVRSSPFADRVEVRHCRFQDLAVGLPGDRGQNCESPAGYDAIVSNPPFFVNSMKNPDSKRALARHADTLPFSELMASASRLLTEDGILSVIVPVEVEQMLTDEAYFKGLVVIERCAVKTVSRKQPKRVLLSFARHRTKRVESHVETMMEPDGTRSAWYKKMTQEFYL